MTKYIALFRGINVGWNNKVEMSKLKQIFESLGFKNVITYINSGNVIFETDLIDKNKLIEEIEKALIKNFIFSIKIILRDANNIQNLCKQIPSDWKNDIEQKTDILFLWDDVDTKKSIDLIAINPNVDTLQYISGAIIWNIKRENYKKSGMNKFIGTKIYKNMTSRNINTLRKINELLK